MSDLVALRKEIASLERRLEATENDEDQNINAQLAELEEELGCDTVSEMDEMEMLDEEPMMDTLDECVECDEDAFDNGLVPDEEPLDEMAMYSSEDSVEKILAGIEDQITQESLKEVEKAAGSGVVTEPSTLSVAPTGYTARLSEAEERLDRVANYLEEQGRKKFAYRVDRIADAVSVERKRHESEERSE